MTDIGDRLRASTKRAIEALVLVAEEPLNSHLLAQLLEVSPTVVDELCGELAGGYESEGRGFQLVRVAGGWRYQTHPDQAPYVERFVLEGQSAKLSAAALETLAIVAYKQPLSRAQVASIRGVSVDGVMRTLQQRGYIDEIGKDPGPGQAILFGTTKLFLEKLGLDSLDELPPLRDFVPNADVVEQLERGLRPDRGELRPEDAIAGADESEDDSDEDSVDALLDSDGPTTVSQLEAMLHGSPDDADADLDDEDPDAEVGDLEAIFVGEPAAADDEPDDEDDLEAMFDGEPASAESVDEPDDR